MKWRVLSWLTATLGCVLVTSGLFGAENRNHYCDAAYEAFPGASKYCRCANNWCSGPTTGQSSAVPGTCVAGSHNTCTDGVSTAIQCKKLKVSCNSNGCADHSHCGGSVTSYSPPQYFPTTVADCL